MLLTSIKEFNATDEQCKGLDKDVDTLGGKKRKKKNYHSIINNK